MPNTSELLSKPSTETLCSTPESWERIRSKVGFLDRLVESGESAEEIEIDVRALADLFAPIFCDWMRKSDFPEFKGIDPESHWMAAHAFVCFTYLGEHPRRASLFKVPKTFDRRFLDLMGEELGISDAMFRAILQVSVDLVRKFIVEVHSDRGH